MWLKPWLSRISIAPTLRSGQLKINHLPGFSPKLLVFRLDSRMEKNGMLEEWKNRKNGMLEEWKYGRMEKMECWKNGRRKS